MSIKLVVFDMAGTTVADENGVTAIFKTAMAKYGYNVAIEQINPIMGYEKKVAIEKMLLENEADKSKITGELIGNIHRDFVQSMVQYYKDATDLKPLPNAEETMLALRSEGKKIGINTGFSREIAENIITKLRWRERGMFDYMVCSDEVLQGRPDPAMISIMMQQAGITDPKEVAKVGDTEVDIREGQNVGCRYVIAVTTGAFTKEQLQPYHPTHIIDDIADVQKIINEPHAA
ncbi:HAD family hydrolase [Mucilaginibacter terrenus]|uniref:HAD family hydrolase n=1 Tax=Mucilaginibacter terrenus TaxID=2482727 RepID=A0A3E2NTE8_9SPHI|nr:HAD-IA family hydrolase [Mucilaginibacter terrenus]RFZ84227.1 HAD family hydrolase [Mucilaginibacter terrenus]